MMVRLWCGVGFWYHYWTMAGGTSHIYNLQRHHWPSIPPSTRSSMCGPDFEGKKTPAPRFRILNFADWNHLSNVTTLFPLLLDEFALQIYGNKQKTERIH